MTEERSYSLSREYLCNVISDIIELQKGKNVTSDSARGQVGFTVRMYGIKHRYEFEILSVDGACRVRIATDGEGNGMNRLRQMFALMESLMGEHSQPGPKL